MLIVAEALISEVLIVVEAHRSEVLIVAEAHVSEVLIVAEVDFVEASVLFEGGIVAAAAAAAVAAAVVAIVAAAVAAAVLDFSFVGSLKIFSGFELLGDEASMAKGLAAATNDDLLAVVVSAEAVAEVSVEL